MKSTTILVSATALACLLVATNAATAWADDGLRGQYAFTESEHCLFALGGFNDSQQPNDPAQSVLESDAVAGVYTFDGRGGLTVDQTFHGISTPASIQNTTFVPYAASENDTGSGDYKFEADGSVTITFAITSANVLSGPSAGLTFTIDQFVLSGRLSPDKKTLLLSATDPVVSTLTFNGLMVPFICNFSGTAVKVSSEPQ